MRARFYTFLAMAFITGAMIGIIGYRFSNDMHAYANVPQHCNQGRAILKRIADYKAAYGELPNQEWFSNLEGLTTTREGYHWFYFNPPRMRGQKDGLLISAAIENNHYYVEGFLDGTMSVTSLRNNQANKARLDTPH